MASREDPRALQLQRCRVETGVSVVNEWRAQLKRSYPNITQADLENEVKFADEDVKMEAVRICASGVPRVLPRH